jgi:hypothetical protein
MNLNLYKDWRITMTKIFALLTAVFVSAIIINSCDNNPVKVTAEKIDIATLSKTPGYTWYEDQFKLYQPNQVQINEIVQKFNPAIDKFCIYVKPSCSCAGTLQQFPAFMKILVSANVPDSCYEIYSMSSSSNDHPYMSMYKVNEIPSFFLLKSASPVYSISDTLTFLKSNSETSAVTLEELVSKSLNK